MVAVTSALLWPRARPVTDLPRALHTREAHGWPARPDRPTRLAHPMERPPPSPPHGATALPYLAPSVCTVAISQRRIVGLQDRLGTFPDRKPGRTRPRTTRLDVFECMRRFLHHVLPAGCMQGRHFGFRHAHWRITTDTIRPMITSHTGAPREQPRYPAPPPAQVTCPHWGAPLIVLSRGGPCRRAICETG
jgi:hypothetical protein